MANNVVENDRIAFAEFELDAARRRLFREGEPVALYAKAFDLLEFLIARNGQVVSKDDILENVWPGQFVEEANLSVQVSALRKALGDKHSAPRFLITVPGKGYKFTADVSFPNSQVVIETSKFSRVVLHEEIEQDEPSDIATVPKTGPSKSINRVAVGAAAVLVLLGAVFAIYRFGGFTSARTAFSDVKLTRLTNSAKVTGAALSPDRKYVAYVSGEPNGNSLWLRQVGTASDIRLLPPTAAQFWGLKFSPDGAYIYYDLFFGDKADLVLFRIPSLGGVAEKIPNVITSTIDFSPDGKRIAFIQPDSTAGFNYLITADPDGSNQQLLAKAAHPDTFHFPGDYLAWSPDGGSIAVVVSRSGENERYTDLRVFDVRDGSARQIELPQLRDIGAFDWLADGLVLSATDSRTKRHGVFQVAPSGGEVRQIIDDLSGYSSITGSADGRAFAALQRKELQSIWLGNIGEGTEAFTEIVSEAGDLSPIVWMPDGRIVFRSDSDGDSNLWVIEADGGNRRQLTTRAGIENRGMCVSPDGKYIVFVSTRAGKTNLWRVDSDGQNQEQLTTGDADAYPGCTPDGSSVIYQKGIYTKPILWRVPVAGGEPVQLTYHRGKWPAISSDGKRVAFMQMTRDKWLIVIASVDGSTVTHRLEAPANKIETTMYWSADDRSLLHIAATGGVGNIWERPIDGSPARQLTNFTSQTITDFAVSPDGKRLAVSRASSVSDIVLVESVE